MMSAMEAFDAATDKVSLPASLLELVRTRASQINGCAFCVGAHSPAALEAGATQKQLLALPVWRESPHFSAQERAALTLTEAITQMDRRPVTDEMWGEVSVVLTEVELAELVWVIAAINVWNRVAGTARPWPVA
ncbi:alkylhydroperoxidase [Frankia sp. CgMI4]|nr:alkylhydroperoxidase [Frankia sp. CgIM4]